MPVLSKRRIADIQSISEELQLADVRFWVAYLRQEFCHAYQIMWVSTIEDYRDCTQFESVKIKAGAAAERYWKSYERKGRKTG